MRRNLKNWKDVLQQRSQWRGPDPLEIDVSIQMHRILMHLIGFAAIVPTSTLRESRVSFNSQNACVSRAALVL
jgi:hypothetical protein